MSLSLKKDVMKAVNYQPPKFRKSSPPPPPRTGSKVGCKYKLPCGMCEILKVYCTERKCKNG